MCRKKIEILNRLKRVFKSEVCPREFKKKAFELGLDPVKEYQFIFDYDPAVDEWLTKLQIEISQKSDFAYLDLNWWSTLRLPPPQSVPNQYDDEDW